MEDSKIYIIKISSYRESSNLYDAIAKDYGKITLIHKGIKSNLKKSQLELFTAYKVDWSGKGDIKFLRNYEIDSKKFLDRPPAKPLNAKLEIAFIFFCWNMLFLFGSKLIFFAAVTNL